MRVCRTVCAALLLLLPVPLHFAQQTDEGRPKLKDFGSSLKKLSWDPHKQSAIESSDPVTRQTRAEDDVVRVQTDLVVLDVQVRDRSGRVVTGLTENDFLVDEDGGRQTIAHFSLGSDSTVPRSIVLILDHSGSLLRYMDRSIDAAKVLVDKLGPKDRMAIVTDDVELVMDFTGDRKKLKTRLESLRHKTKNYKLGRSFQMTALMATVRELFDAEDIRPIVIFQTDGDEVGLLQPADPQYYFLPEVPENAPAAVKTRFENVSRRVKKDMAAQIKPFSLADVYKAIEKSRATVYTVIPGQELLSRSAEDQMAIVKSTLLPWYSDEQIRRIARYELRAQKAAAGAAIVSGGWTAFLTKPEAAADIYSTILSDINSRYVIGYYPANKIRDGRRRSVSVEVRGHPEYVLLGRRSFYAPEPEQ